MELLSVKVLTLILPQKSLSPSLTSPTSTFFVVYTMLKFKPSLFRVSFGGKSEVRGLRGHDYKVKNNASNCIHVYLKIYQFIVKLQLLDSDLVYVPSMVLVLELQTKCASDFFNLSLKR